MEEIAKNTLITILITFNAFVGYQEGKKVYQEHQKYKVDKNQRNLKLKIKKTGKCTQNALKLKSLKGQKLSA